MLTLVVVGACYLDTILTVPYYPKEDEKLRAVSLSKRRGGNGPNTIEVLGQLTHASDGIEAPLLALCSVLPSASSAAFKQIEASLGSDVAFCTCIYREAYTEAASSYIISSTDSGTRTIVNYNELPEMTPAEFRFVCTTIESRNSWYHFEGRIPEVTLDCIKHLRQQYTNVSISVEVEKSGRAGLEELATEADVVFYSQSWARSKGYSSAKECLQAQSIMAQRAMILFCTWGEAGSAAFQRATGTIFEAPAFKLSGSQPIDSTGAGDAFIAGVLFSLTYGGPDGFVLSSMQSPHGDEHVPKILQFANEVAGRKVIQVGYDGLGQAVLPTILGHHDNAT